MRGHPVIRGHFLRMVPHVEETAIKGQLSCWDIILNIEVSIEDRFNCSLILSHYQKKITVLHDANYRIASQLT